MSNAYAIQFLKILVPVVFYPINLLKSQLMRSIPSLFGFHKIMKGRTYFKEKHKSSTNISLSSPFSSKISPLSLSFAWNHLYEVCKVQLQILPPMLLPLMPIFFWFLISFYLYVSFRKKQRRQRKYLNPIK